MNNPCILVAPGPYKECIDSFKVADAMKEGIEEIIMQEIWKEFCDYYGYKLYKYPLVVILEAFWHYAKGEMARCDVIFSRYDKKISGK